MAARWLIGQVLLELQDLEFENGERIWRYGDPIVKSLHICVKRVRQSFRASPASALLSSPHHVSNIVVVRRNNVVTLFQQFAEEQMRIGIPPKGLEQAFAQKLQVSPSMWSQIKSSRPIGDKLARQIEAACDRGNGWLDEERAAAGLTPGEQQFLVLALKAWRGTTSEGRKRLKGLLRDACVE
jgi:hypothetical protein